MPLAEGDLKEHMLAQFDHRLDERLSAPCAKIQQEPEAMVGSGGKVSRTSPPRKQRRGDGDDSEVGQVSDDAAARAPSTTAGSSKVGR